MPSAFVSSLIDCFQRQSFVLLAIYLTCKMMGALVGKNADILMWEQCQCFKANLQLLKKRVYCCHLTWHAV